MHKEENQKTELTQAQRAKIVEQTASVGIFGNIALAAFKLAAGLFGHSTAMVTDAIHSLSDVFATLIAFIGTKMSAKEADEDHPYGHDRFECIASLLLAGILFATGAGIGGSCIRKLADGSYKEAAVPALIALIAAIVSILTKEAMFWYTMHQAKVLESSAFRADAWHHRSDALSSIGSLVGIAFARSGFPIMDTIAGLIICAMIIYVAFGIFREASAKMLDHAAPPGFSDDILQIVNETAREQKVDIGIDKLMTREFGEKYYVDMEINLDGDMKLKNAHAIAALIHNKIESRYSKVKHVMIHINPAGYSYHVD